MADESWQGAITRFAQRHFAGWLREADIRDGHRNHPLWTPGDLEGGAIERAKGRERGTVRWWGRWLKIKSRADGRWF